MKNIAIITGASSGIGKAFFLGLIARQPDLDEVWVVARSADKLHALESLSPIPLRVFALDLSIASSADVLEEALQAEQPNLRYLVCASGFGRFDAVEDDERKVLENMLDLNCRAVLSLTKIATPYLQQGSVVILIASVASFQPIPYIATYAASKSFVLSYGRAWNREIGKSANRAERDAYAFARSGRKRRFSTAQNRAIRSSKNTRLCTNPNKS